jgi:mitofilin
LATTSTETTATTAASAPKNKHTVRSIIFYTAAATGTFYIGSPFVAFNSQTYYDFFTESVPLGQSVIEFAEEHDWDEFTADSLVHAGIEGIAAVSELFSTLFGAQTTAEKAKVKADEKKAATADKYKESKDRLKSVTTAIKTKVEKTEEKLLEGGNKATASAQYQVAQFSAEVEELIRKAEEALATPSSRTLSTGSEPTASTTRATTTDSSTLSDKKVYNGSLPLEHEPPYGFSRPTPPKTEPACQPEANAPPPPLPLIAPSVVELNLSEPVVVQLASTIDNLASYLNSNPTAAEKAKGILESAKKDLTGLASRIETIKSEERAQLEKLLEEQANECTTKLLELEMEAQDKLDSQEEGFRKFVDEQRMQLVQAYREKLDHELQTQTELINER